MPPRPKKRRDPLSETQVFQVRIDIAGARPPIWRRTDIRSNVSLWTLHRVIQGAFGWYDAHLYRFSLGDLHSWESELFLCDFDMQEGDDEGTFVEEVRLDETLQAPGDELEYLYDYGDNWQLKITLEQRRLATPRDPTAVCTAGRRAAPPEDSGGITDPDYLAEFIRDPALFDLTPTNEIIGSWLETPPGFAPAGVIPGLSETEEQEHAQLRRFPQFRHILDHCYDEEVRLEITRRLQLLESSDGAGTDRRIADDDSARLESLSAVQLLLDQIGTGVRLTKAGYLPPKIAVRIGEELGLFGFQLASSGESKMLQVVDFRTALQHVGLLRKDKGDLVLTKAGKDGLEAPPLLWNHLVARLLPRNPSTRTFSHDAALLVLLFAATSGGDLNLEAIAQLMTALGWRVDGVPATKYDVVFQGSWQTVLLWYIAPKDQRLWFKSTVSSAASELARGALLRMKPAASV